MSSFSDRSFLDATPTLASPMYLHVRQFEVRQDILTVVQCRHVLGGEPFSNILASALLLVASCYLKMSSACPVGLLVIHSLLRLWRLQWASKPIRRTWRTCISTACTSHFETHHVGTHCASLSGLSPNKRDPSPSCIVLKDVLRLRVILSDMPLDSSAPRIRRINIVREIQNRAHEPN